MGILGAGSALGAGVGSKLGGQASDSISDSRALWKEGKNPEEYEVAQLKKELLKDPEYQRAYSYSTYEGENKATFIRKCRDYGIKDPRLIKQMMLNRDKGARNEKALFKTGEIVQSSKALGYKKKDIEQAIQNATGEKQGGSNFTTLMNLFQKLNS